MLDEMPVSPFEELLRLREQLRRDFQCDLLALFRVCTHAVGRAVSVPALGLDFVPTRGEGPPPRYGCDNTAVRRRRANLL